MRSEWADPTEADPTPEVWRLSTTYGTERARPPRAAPERNRGTRLAGTRDARGPYSGQSVGDCPPSASRAVLYSATAASNSSEVSVKVCSPQVPGSTT